MARKNSKQARYDAMSQGEIRRLERNKKYKNPRRDGTSWVDKVLQKIKEAEEENENGGIN
jgi:hypothetical protein